MALSKKKIVKQAAVIMNISEGMADKVAKEIPEINALYFQKPVNGGVQVIIGKDGSILLAPFIVKEEEMIEAYKSGARSA